MQPRFAHFAKKAAGDGGHPAVAISVRAGGFPVSSTMTLPFGKADGTPHSTGKLGVHWHKGYWQSMDSLRDRSCWRRMGDGKRSVENLVLKAAASRRFGLPTMLRGRFERC